jgi:hypothetical protein
LGHDYAAALALISLGTRRGFFFSAEEIMSTLYFNPQTKVIFASDELQDTAHEITADEVDMLKADGATVDPSADTVLGNSTQTDGAQAAPAVDASANGSATEGEQGNVSSDPATVASVSDTSATASDSASTDSATSNTTSTDDSGSNLSSSEPSNAGNAAPAVDTSSAAETSQTAPAADLSSSTSADVGNALGGAPSADSQSVDASSSALGSGSDAGNASAAVDSSPTVTAAETPEPASSVQPEYTESATDADVGNVTDDTSASGGDGPDVSSTDQSTVSSAPVDASGTPVTGVAASDVDAPEPVVTDAQAEPGGAGAADLNPTPAAPNLDSQATPSTVSSDGVITNVILWDGESEWTPPENATVVALEDGSSVSIGWTYDGSNFTAPSPPPPPVLSPEQIKAQNTAMRDSLLVMATNAIAPLQDAVDLDEATDAETALLKQWKQYRVAVNRVDLTAQNVIWPSPPA